METKQTVPSLRADGTFICSSGAADWGIGSMSFDGEPFVIHNITWCESTETGDQIYFVDGQKATWEEFEAA